MISLERKGIEKCHCIEYFLRYAEEAKVDGVVVGATRPNIIREVASAKPAPIFSPGIGRQGGVA